MIEQVRINRQIAVPGLVLAGSLVVSYLFASYLLSDLLLYAIALYALSFSGVVWLGCSARNTIIRALSIGSGIGLIAAFVLFLPSSSFT